MFFDIITIFPEIFDSYLNESILKRAQEKKLIKVKIHNLRDFTLDKHHKVDDRPYGGGPGMVFYAEPIIRAVKAVMKGKKSTEYKKTLVVFFSPSGKLFDNKKAINLTKKFNRVIFVCDRYEGVDARTKKVVKDLGFPIETLSIGSYVLTGGEIPAMVVIDSTSRQIKGVLGKEESLEEERFGIGLPVYTRPAEFIIGKKKYAVPEILVSGNHAEIEKWHRNNTKGKKEAK